MKIIQFLIVSFISLSITSAHADATGEVLGDTAKGAVVGGAIGAVGTKVGQAVIGEEAAKKLGDFFNSPHGILLMSGMATVYSGVLYNAAGEQEDECEKNIRKIDVALKELGDSFEGFCPNGHNDLNDANCYCYDDGGNENKDRTRSKTCQDLWAKNKFKNKATASSYAGLSKFVDPVGCVNIYGQFDENCKCKKFVDKKGQNSCKKNISVEIPNAISGAMIANTGLSEVLRFAANANNGNPNFNNFSNMGLGLKAISTNALQQKMFGALNKKNGNASVGYINEDNIDKVAKAVFGEKTLAAAKASTANNLSLAANQKLDDKTESIIKAASKKIGVDMVGSGSGLNTKKIEKKESFSFNLGDNSSANGNANVQDFNDPKAYKIKSDISKDPGVSIFEIISNRYLNSGLKRLFDDK